LLAGGFVAAPVKIMVLDGDEESRQTLRHLLDCEGWLVHFVDDTRTMMNELVSGEWSLLVVNIEMAPPGGPLFSVLRDLSQAEIIKPGSQDRLRSIAGPRKDEAAVARRLGVLFLVPVELAYGNLAYLERDRLPYAVRPYHLQDFFEKVSDLLIEVGAIPRPIRASRFQASTLPGERARTTKGARTGSMFASRQDYMMSEEEIAEYERQEAEEAEKKKKKKGQGE
jgi:hypothetical protein